MKKSTGISVSKDMSKNSKPLKQTSLLSFMNGGKAQPIKPSGHSSITGYLNKKPQYTTLKNEASNDATKLLKKSTIKNSDDFNLIDIVPKTPETKRNFIKKSYVVPIKDVSIKQNSTTVSSKKSKIKINLSDSDDEFDFDHILPTPLQNEVFKFPQFAENDMKDDTDSDVELSGDIIPPTPNEDKTLKLFSNKKRTRENVSPKGLSKRNCHSSPFVKKLEYHRGVTSLPVTKLTYENMDEDFDNFIKLEDKSSTQDDNTIASPSLLQGIIFTDLKEREDSISEESPTILEKNVQSIDDLSFDFDNLSPFKMSQEKEAFPVGQYRYIVKSVHSISQMEKALTLAPDIKNKETKLRRSVILKDFWADTYVNENDIVHVLGVEFKSDSALINSEIGIIVVNPDVLISSTAISSVLFCIRKTFLSEVFKSWDGGNKAMLIGSIVHQLFQTTLEKKMTTKEQITGVLTEIFESPKILQDLYSMDLSIGEIKNAVAGYAAQILSWVEKFASQKPSSLTESKDTAELVSVRDIEENFWSPTLGLKGKIDVTAEVKIHKGRTHTKLLPIELKTGKPSFSVEHQGQIILYSMMMSERYPDPQGGLLLYLQNNPQMKFVEAKRNNQTGLLAMRNNLARYFSTFSKGELEFPEPATRYDFCKNCPMLIPCSLAERTMEKLKTSERPSGRQELVASSTKHLNDSDLQYFLHWFELIHLEFMANSERNSNKYFWNVEIEKRELKGVCISNLKISSVDPVTNSLGFYHKFARCPENIKLGTGIFKVNDTVVISCLKTPLEIAIAMGSIVQLSGSEIHLHLDKNLTKRIEWKNESYTMDVYNSISVLATNFRNLARLMIDTDETKTLRSLIIDKCEPKPVHIRNDEIISIMKRTAKGVNKIQRIAIYKSLLADKYFLIQGMPGTGKTTTIVNLVKTLVALKRSVLLTSYTHSAVDNILLKLKANGVNFMRMGKTSKVHSELKAFTCEAKTADLKELSQIEQLYNSIPVIATTCLSLNEAIFQRRKFSVCIVDEAAQIPQPVCLGPLFTASTFILVGDSKQLPPLAQSKTAKEKGFCESLFQRLESSQQVQQLTMQYRMNKEIMRIANELTYENKLVAGNDSVANSTLRISFGTVPQSNEWHRILSVDLKDSVLFLNTSPINAEETNNGHGSISNKEEAKIVVSIAKKFIKDSQLDPECFGIISPYRDQVRLITEMLQESSVNVEINTVDQYQGRDKDIIIFSAVRSSKKEIQLGEILHDSKRLNVAITRAKYKLLLIGDMDTLNSYPPFAKLFHILRPDQIICSPTV